MWENLLVMATTCQLARLYQVPSSFQNSSSLTQLFRRGFAARASNKCRVRQLFKSQSQLPFWIARVSVTNAALSSPPPIFHCLLYLDVNYRFALLYVALEELDYGWKIGVMES